MGTLATGSDGASTPNHARQKAVVQLMIGRGCGPVPGGTCLLPELGAERGQLALRNPDHYPEKLLLSDRALMRAGVDEAGEVLTEGADAGEVALRDRAPQLPQAAGVLRGKDTGGDAAWRRLDGRRGRGEREGAGCGECEGPELHRPSFQTATAARVRDDCRRQVGREVSGIGENPPLVAARAGNPSYGSPKTRRYKQDRVV